MEKFDLYKDIQMRTNGEIYLGIVGPVRTGKSTFISKFMQSSILDNITNEYEKQRNLETNHPNRNQYPFGHRHYAWIEFVPLSL